MIYYLDELTADGSVKNHLLEDIIVSKESYDDSLGLTKTSLLLIDTFPYLFHECMDFESESKLNFGEAMIIKHFLEYLKNTLFLKQSDIGIITPYSAQVLVKLS